MRADRLVATLLLLQARGRLTAAEIATELEVSVPTTRRDLEALSAAGVPVYPQPGRGGGWQLVGGARTDLSGLSAPEAQALFAIAGPAAYLSPEAKAALRKLVRALPATFRKDAEAAAAATTIDPARWGELGSERPQLVEALQRAVVERRTVRLTYTDARGDSSSRDVDPLGLVAKDETWYLVAGTDRGRRTFRVDRVAAAQPTDLTFERPADFDLDAEWQRVVNHVEERRSQTWATVTVERRFVSVLHDRFGRHCRELAPAVDGRARVEVAAPTPLDLARNLAGWSGLLDVEGPSEVTHILARIGAELVARYAQ